MLSYINTSRTQLSFFSFQKLSFQQLSMVLISRRKASIFQKQKLAIILCSLAMLKVQGTHIQTNHCQMLNNASILYVCLYIKMNYISPQFLNYPHRIKRHLKFLTNKDSMLQNCRSEKNPLSGYVLLSILVRACKSSVITYVIGSGSVLQSLSRHEPRPSLSQMLQTFCLVFIRKLAEILLPVYMNYRYANKKCDLQSRKNGVYDSYSQQS